MTGISFSTCCAASWPSLTSSAGLYLFLGAWTAVWAVAVTTNAARLAATSADSARTRHICTSSTSAVAASTLFIAESVPSRSSALESEVPDPVLLDAQAIHPPCAIAPERDRPDTGNRKRVLRQRPHEQGECRALREHQRGAVGRDGELGLRFVAHVAARIVLQI